MAISGHAVDATAHSGFQVHPYELVRTAACATVFTLLLVSFNPFPAALEQDQSVPLNQIGYTILAIMVAMAHLLVTDRQVLRVLANPWWLLLVLPLPVSLVFCGMPSDSARAMFFTLTTMFIATGVLTLAPDIRGFRLSLAIACLTVLSLSYLGVVALPLRAIHQASEVESEHAGLWRGIYAHKNIAGPVMASIAFAGLYLFRSGSRFTGSLIFILGSTFLLKTGSKTSTALVPVIASLVILGPAVANRAATALVLFAAFAFILFLTLGSAVSPGINQLVQDIIPGTTFSGRMDLWSFALDLGQHLPLTGFGYDNFWGRPMVELADKPYWLDWDMRGAAHAHNAYLDLALQLGWWAVGTTLIAILILPLIDYARCRPEPENRRLADFFLMTLGFMLLNATMESFFFDRDKAGWMLLWISVMGLRFTRTMSIAR